MVGGVRGGRCWAELRGRAGRSVVAVGWGCGMGMWDVEEEVEEEEEAAVRCGGGLDGRMDGGRDGHVAIRSYCAG